MNKDFIIDELQQTFKNYESFTRKALFDFFLQFESDLSEATFRWRIYNLKKSGLIRPLSRHELTLHFKPSFEPKIEDVEKKIFLHIQKEFKDLKHIIWSTKIINEFMLHQPGKFFTILETEKDAVEPVFHFLLDHSIKNVFLEPEQKEISRYISQMESAIVIKSLVSKAPVQKTGQINTITIEKLLVDLFTEKKLFHAYQGSELSYIFNNAYNRYAIDFTKLLGYAKRRKKPGELIEYLHTKTDIPKYILNDR